MHHRYVKYNFGIYFNFWDRVMKTNHPKYEENFEQVIVQREQEKAIRDALAEPTKADFIFAESEKVLPEI
ncbi:MAG: hypothetical protein M3O71_10645 [Bacteroidota bacterium]|nr:hypothetical protein [Bacteroidota bacterium]